MTSNKCDHRYEKKTGQRFKSELSANAGNVFPSIREKTWQRDWNAKQCLEENEEGEPLSKQSLEEKGGRCQIAENWPRPILILSGNHLTLFTGRICKM